MILILYNLQQIVNLALQVESLLTLDDVYRAKAFAGTASLS